MQQRAEADLLDALLIEMAQTERSAKEHPRKEANRLGVDEPPARALLAVADHAERRLPELERLVGSTRSSIGEAIGNTFSVLREALADRLVSKEKSYRGTLIGLHHGVDCALLTRAVASVCERPELVRLLTVWLEEREPLVARCQREVEWFAAHADVARERAA
jgi:hypothetical protein